MARAMEVRQAKLTRNTPNVKDPHFLRRKKKWH